MPPSAEFPDHERFAQIDAAFRHGDLDRLRLALGSPDGFPNVAAHPAAGTCLGYAIYHSPLSFIRDLLEGGAFPDECSVDDGFPPLLAAFDRSPASDRCAVLDLLLAHGANPNRRGINDDTALHRAADIGDLAAVELLLAHGADANQTTRIDNFDTPLERAAAAGHNDIVAVLKALNPGSAGSEQVAQGDVEPLGSIRPPSAV